MASFYGGKKGQEDGLNEGLGTQLQEGRKRKSSESAPSEKRTDEDWRPILPPLLKKTKTTDTPLVESNANGGRAILLPPLHQIMDANVINTALTPVTKENAGILRADEDKENNPHPSTPSAKSTEAYEPLGRKTTPGRFGPVKPLRFDILSPKIKPFKGPKGSKVRKTRWEKDQEYKQHIRDTPDHVFHELYVCFDKGPNGSPTYDKSGFQLDYEKVADWMRPRAYNKASMVNGMEKALEREKQERKKMTEIFFAAGEAPDNTVDEFAVDYYKDRVSKDLDIPWHKIGVKEFEEWARRGFPKARRGEYTSFTEEEKARMRRLHDGCRLRK